VDGSDVGVVGLAGDWDPERGDGDCRGDVAISGMGLEVVVPAGGLQQSKRRQLRWQWKTVPAGPCQWRQLQCLATVEATGMEVSGGRIGLFPGDHTRG
jgi:hypothetical protein